MSPPPDLRRKRLLFRSWHRGTRESDLILGRFAETHLVRFDAVQLDRYEALLECSDAEIFDWVAGRTSPPPAHDHDVTRLLLSFRYSPPAFNPSPPFRGEREGTHRLGDGEGEVGANGSSPLTLPSPPAGAERA